MNINYFFNLGASCVFSSAMRRKKHTPGYSLQFLGFADAKPAGFPLLSLAPHGLTECFCFRTKTFGAVKQKMPARPGRSIFFIAILFAIFLAGCRSAPPALPPVHPSEALPSDAAAYFYVSVQENTELLGGFLQEGTGSRYFIEHTTGMYGAVSKGAADETETAGVPGFLIAAEGDYSVGLVEFGIGREDDWEETPVPVSGGEARYYRNKISGMEIAIPSPRLMLIGTKTAGLAQRLAALYAGAASPLPEETLAAFESHAAGFYLPLMGKGGLPPLVPAGLPFTIGSILILADPTESGHAVSGSVAFENQETATAAAFLLRMIFANLMSLQGASNAEIRNTLKITAEGKLVKFSGLSFPAETAKQILGSLLAGDAAK